MANEIETYSNFLFYKSEDGKTSIQVIADADAGAETIWTTLKQGGTVFGKQYFDELLERIREIRASERMFYQKLTDIFAQSYDYDKTSPITFDFYSSIQNKLEYAVIG